jgi:hypothetical protein
MDLAENASMPPRFVYWTIIAGGLPTSFRAADRDELLPTFRRIQEKHPDAEMKYFARGKLWASAEEARAAARADRAPASGSFAGRERRGRDWRPGGEHRDPRQPFKDAKKARNQDRRQDRWERKNQTREPARRDAERAPRERPHGDPLVPRGERRAAPKRPFRKPENPRTAAPRGKWTDKAPRTKPHGDKFRDEGARREFKPSGRRFERNQQTPPRPPGPNREPKPGREPKPEPPPRPSEPQTLPPGPPERGAEPPARPSRKRQPEK